ncbi:MAG: Outer membrane efflux protein [Candidatus Kaiserbacteria bacterium GW2011_GWA2_49_19]|uniref:Outer membrane efflux protein n=1 Tax=Candidatus Kaiserbacteria bacterium GW2011_GWA2_49_19 TaxID=1618669 RepID=A0A0G1YPT3_9BACT|nr:MAG: Outer membrane efflux protein [Candidatus Kaiserbacteria bacterium GW2011_GWA2_49_19]
MLRKIVTLVLVCVMFFQGSFLYGSETASLDTLIQEAKEKNPEILAAKKRWEASLARIPQEKSLENPSLGLTFEKIPRGTLKLDQTMPEDRMLTVSQFLPLFGKLSLKGKIAVIESQMAAGEYKDKELEIINAVKNAYYDLWMNHQEIELSEHTLHLLTALAKVAESRYRVNAMTQEELLKINLEIAGGVNAIANLKLEQRTKQTKLNSLLVRDLENSLGVPELTEQIGFKDDISSLYTSTLQNKPELIILSKAIEKNKNARSLAKRSFFPDLMASVVQRGITSGSLGPWDLMLSFTVPFWFWTKERYMVKEAIANLEEAQAVYEAMKNKALSETKDMYTRIEIAKNKIQLYQDTQIPLLEASIQTSMNSFRSGQGDMMILLDSMRMFTETQMDYYRALADYHMNIADLERAVGVELEK